MINVERYQKDSGCIPIAYVRSQPLSLNVTASDIAESEFLKVNANKIFS